MNEIYIPENFFYQPQIKKLETMDYGYETIMIYLRLLLLANEIDGKIKTLPDFDSFAYKFSIDRNSDFDTIVKAFQNLLNVKLLELCGSQEIFLPKWQEMLKVN